MHMDHSLRLRQCELCYHLYTDISIIIIIRQYFCFQYRNSFVARWCVQGVMPYTHVLF